MRICASDQKGLHLLMEHVVLSTDFVVTLYEDLGRAGEGSWGPGAGGRQVPRATRTSHKAHRPQLPSRPGKTIKYAHGQPGGRSSRCCPGQRNAQQRGLLTSTVCTMCVKMTRAILLTRKDNHNSKFLKGGLQTVTTLVKHYF